ncbi:MAG: hypothetical protein NTV58_15045 [Deltaproteobacteria bacterium]|nr:hypothetical protein [Deltaproteobacteria bacterium]
MGKKLKETMWTEKEVRKVMGAACNDLLTVNNKLCCIAGLIDPRNTDHNLLLDYTESIGLAELIKDCVIKISEVSEVMEDLVIIENQEAQP